MRRLAETLTTETPRNGRYRVVRIAEVLDTTCSVEYMNGSSGTDQLSNVRRVKSYSPIVGEQALLWTDGAFQILVGAIA